MSLLMQIKRPQTSGPTPQTRDILKAYDWQLQCESSIGIGGFDSMLLVAPPRMNSRNLE
jgi:hypothetical protein